MGSIIVAIKGPFKTTITFEEPQDARKFFSPDNLTIDAHVGVECIRVIYQTTYCRWWIPDEIRTAYVVKGQAPPEIAEGLDPRLLESVTYPLLCNKFLEWTPFPFYYAIRAYLARLD
jgi:hypothetical protein